MNIFIFLGLFLVCMILTIIFLGLWVYRDAKNRGLNAAMWTAIVILVPNLIGLIIYFLIGRKQVIIKCNKCSADIPESSKYCCNCGSEVTKLENINERSTKGFLIGFIAFFIAMFIGIIGFGISIFMNEGFDEMSSGVSIGLIESNIGDKWKVSYISSTEEFHRNIKIKDNNPKTLYIESECGEGKLYLTIAQNSTEEKIDITEGSNTREIDLSNFKEGTVKLKLVGEGAKHVKFRAYWK